MDKLFIVEIEWNLKGDSGHDILAVTTLSIREETIWTPNKKE
jgi:hypothetical protein